MKNYVRDYETIHKLFQDKELTALIKGGEDVKLDVLIAPSAPFIDGDPKKPDMTECFIGVFLLKETDHVFPEEVEFKGHLIQIRVDKWY